MKDYYFGSQNIITNPAMQKSWDSTDILNPLIVQLLYVRRDMPTYCIVTPTNVRDFGRCSWRAMADRKRRQQQTVDPEGFYMQYVSTTYTITNQSHTCHLVGVVTNFSRNLHSDSNTTTNCHYLLHPKVGTYAVNKSCSCRVCACACVCVLSGG